MEVRHVHFNLGQYHRQFSQREKPKHVSAPCPQNYKRRPRNWTPVGRIGEPRKSIRGKEMNITDPALVKAIMTPVTHPMILRLSPYLQFPSRINFHLAGIIPVERRHKSACERNQGRYNSGVLQALPPVPPR